MSETDKLLQELIQATDRTTRAVRAFVRFLFIQLAAITLAIVVFQLGVITQDPSECAFGICSPNGFTTTVAVLIWLGGVIWSSKEGWEELDASAIPHGGRAAPALGSASVPRSNGAGKSCGGCGTRNEFVAAFCASCGKDL